MAQAQAAAGEKAGGRPSVTAVPKSQDFGEWYNEVVELAELTDKRYPIKGMNIWRPYGWAVMSRIDAYTRAEMARTGHDEVSFPLMIPERLFMKEAEQIKGFGGEVFWVTHAGENELPEGERWVVRPTSECAMYEVFPLWIRSHTDLPLQTYQICNVFRYETKQTRAFMRVREIHFFEDHSVFADEKSAREHVMTDLEVVANVFRHLALPALQTKRPDWDKFPGAVDSIGADVVMPSGRTLQCATVHYYGENFARAYSMTYEDDAGQHRHCHQTTYGMSERLVGAVVGCHGDDHGLVLPPAVAPIQAVIVPILFKGETERVLDHCRRVRDLLLQEGLRVHLDERERSAGDKFYHWELRGVPLRLEIGPKDIEKGTVLTARRDRPGKEGKKPLALDLLVDGLRVLMDEIQTDLEERQRGFVRSRLRRVATLEEAKRIDAEETLDVVFEMPISGDAAAKKVEEELDIKTLGVPVDAPAEATGEACAVTGEPATVWVRFARTY